ncbi:lipid A export permease/ATP-binding protein MsbA [Candidatus Vondammii sp. HM_W22]|uniref:lipid A export permease/ATP-binding protein MsbA n=1 Tax=Candidatus Vondammii sp. HM_W22 TaxID=2687299 RepID=UPI001F145A35|nr:lipid A export permease/ATP-binding protein MsbA [Candidatus Vondammii sp. HM_W22]
MSTYHQYIRLLTYVRPHWKLFSISIFATIIMAATQPAMPALLKPLLDGSFVEKDPDMIALMPILLVLLFVARGISTFISTITMENVATKVVFGLRQLMLQRLLTLPTKYYDQSVSGVTLSKITFDVEQLTQAASRVLIILVRDSLSIIGLLGLILYINWRLALIAFALIPIVAIMVQMISKRLREISRTLQARMGNMTHILEEVINGHKVIKLFAGQKYESGRFDETANKVRLYRVKNVVATTANVQFIQLLAVSGLALMAYLAAQQSFVGGFTVGEFVAFFGAMAMLLSPLKKLTGINAELQRGLAAAESVFTFLDQETEQDHGKQRLKKAKGKLAWEGVEHRFSPVKDPALKNIALTVSPGENIALVGPSGCGKTTLTNLLPRFYQPSEGRILLDDIDIAELKLDDLRSNIALVSQKITLFNDTIRANIAYGTMNEVSDDAVRDAAKAANALEFIEAMPDGMNEIIGDNGIRLSGGQRQRIAIARALLKDAPILIFDEATSALDAESEQKIQLAMDALRRGRTTITIAHRLSTIEQADRIVVLDRGEIVELGSHRELLAQDGLYKKLYQIQFTVGRS